MLLRVRLTPDHSDLSQMSRQQHLESYGKANLWWQREQLSSTHVHSHTWVHIWGHYEIKPSLSQMMYRAPHIIVTVWYDVFCCSYTKLMIRTQQKRNTLKNSHFQTNRILDRMTTQTVLCKGGERGSEWHSIILSVWANCWETQMLFMVQSTGKKEGRQSSLSFKCLAIAMQSCSNERVFKMLFIFCALAIQMFIYLDCIPSVSRACLTLTFCECDASQEHTPTEKINKGIVQHDTLCDIRNFTLPWWKKEFSNI